ncbi:MAG TPA: acyltransferase domain-containing protein, partial [Burkholderiaceae bacterium]|nr:acyltransferase domain-containing protein [Burkholderiaceae bacterium]
GLSAAGFGGANFHAVVSAYANDTPAGIGVVEWPAELFLFRGDDRAHASASMAALERWLGADTTAKLRDLAAAVSIGTAPVQVAVVASSVEELRDALVLAKQYESDGSRVFCRQEVDGKVAFLFPGQGSQRVGMLADLFVAFPALQRLLRLGEPYLDRMFPAGAFSIEEAKVQRAALADTRVAQPALGIADLAMAELLKGVGVTPQMAAGHSYGELVALCVAGVYDAPTLIELSAARADCILAAAPADPGAMAAIDADIERVRTLIADTDVIVANHNAPQQAVISGPTAKLKALLEKFRAAGINVHELPVACAFHSPLVAGAESTLAAKLAAVPFEPASFEVWSNTEAAPYPTDAAPARTLLARQLAKPVRFMEQIEAMYLAGARVFVEVGPGSVLTKLVGQILGNRAHVAIGCDRSGEPGIKQWLTALAQLAAAGVKVDVATLFAQRHIAKVDLHGAVAQMSKSAWRVNGQRALPLHGELPPGSFRPPLEPVAVYASSRPARAYNDEEDTMNREQMIVEFLRTTREAVTAQRDVLLGYLGQPIAFSPQIAAPPLAVSATVVASEARAIAHTPAATPPVAAAPTQDVGTVLLTIVAERTGYPKDMLELDLDMEADLSIDSIKRIEILGELRQRVGVSPRAGMSDEQLVEQLAAIKTLRGIIAWIEANGKSAPAATPATTAGAMTPPAKTEDVTQ